MTSTVITIPVLVPPRSPATVFPVQVYRIASSSIGQLITDLICVNIEFLIFFELTDLAGVRKLLLHKEYLFLILKFIEFSVYCK